MSLTDGGSYRRHNLSLIGIVLLLLCNSAVARNSVDLGLGYGIVDSAGSSAVDSGWDLQLGYEFSRVNNWNVGVQAQFLRGTTPSSGIPSSGDLSFSSNALYLTMRPDYWGFYLKGGVVDATYHILGEEQQEIGYGIGAGVSMEFGGVRFHLIDYQRYQIGAASFNVYTISITVFDGGLRF